MRFDIFMDSPIKNPLNGEKLAVKKLPENPVLNQPVMVVNA